MTSNIQQQQPQTSIWLNNPLANLFRRSGRKPKKEAKRENEGNYLGISVDKKTKRSSSCDALHQSRLSTRFVDNQRKTPELLINGNSTKEKPLEMNSTKISRGGLNSSFSSLLHQRIFLSSRGASPFVPNKLYKTSKGEAQIQKGRLPSKTRCTSKSQQNISRLIDTEEINASKRHSRRDHSLGATTPRISLDSQIIRQVPINIQTQKHFNNFEENKKQFLNTKTIKNSISLTKIITTSTTTLISPKGYQQQKEKENNFSECSSNSSFQQQKYQNYDIKKEERNLALEKWMLTQPISIRKYEKHERIRLKITDERDAIQKKTFTKWVNQHLSKTNKIVEDLFFDLRDGRNLIDLLELLTAENLPRENGMTRFHRIQNVQSCLEFLRRRNIRLVNIRPEDIVDGNGKLTLGLIWTIILNFQVSAVINYQQKSQRRQDITVHISATTSPHNKIINSQQDEGVHYSQTTARLIAESSVSQRERQTPSPETSSFSSETRTTTSARDALLAWARRVISTFHPEVDVHNFSSNWRDGFAFDAILHCFRPELVNWEKVLHLSARERLQFAFDTFESEYGIAKLLDPEDVCDVETPDERSLITYVSMLHNRLINEPKGGYDDVLSRLTRGIGITNEKLDHLLVRIDNVNVAEERGERFEILERQVREIVDDLHALKPPIDELFTDVETLRQQRHSQTADLNKQVVGLEQRRAAYLGRLEDGIMTRLGIRPKAQFVTERVTSTTTADGGSLAYKGNAFRRVEDAIQWIRDRMYKLNTMQFSETLEMLEQMFEKQKLDNRDIQDFRQTVDECIARQAEVSAEDSYDYFELLKILESEYQQLRELSAGRMVDLDSLIAFIRAAQLELVWIHEREELEVTRNWSAVQQLDIPMLQNYFKQLLHEIELHEKQFNDVHNQGAALINQRHPAGEVIEVYLRTMQNQWDWLLNLSKCLEGHLRDAYNAKSFLEESDQIEQQMQQQLNHLDHSYNRTDFSLDEGERMLRELDSIREHIQQLHARLLSLTERCSQISPLWQRGERIGRPIPVISLCEYKSKESHVRQGDECTLLDNHDLLHWCIRGMDGVEASVPSVVFRIPPPDPRLSNLLSRFHGQFERLRKLWDRKHHLTRYNMVLSTMRTVRGWDLDTFLSIPPDQRDEIIKALNEDVNKLLSELDPNDPLARRLKDELRLTNEHFYDLLGRAQKGPEPNYANEFDAAAVELIRKFEDAFKQLSERAQIRIPNNLEQLEHQIREHKIFEDNLQALDVDVSNVKELFRQLPSPTPNQRAKHDLMISRWEEIWDLCRMYVERLKALENVLKSVDEVSDIVRRHEVTLSSFDDMPAALERLRGVHAQLVELLMVLQQQRSIVENLNKDTAQIRSHVARTRLGVQHHPDVDQLEELVTNLTVRWDNVNSQVTDRLRIAEEAQQTQMVYRSQYDEELQWLDRVEATINSLRRPEDLRPEELQGQLDQLTAEYAQLQEHTATIEAINNEGGKFIRDARSYDIKLAQYHDNIISAHGQRIKDEFRRQIPQPKNGAQIVTEELEALNRRFAQLSSVILERKNIVNVLIQNWRRKQQDSLHSECIRRNADIHSLISQLGQLQRSQLEQIQKIPLNTEKEARSRFVEMREKLNSYSTEVAKQIAEADRLCVECADSLSPEQFHLLKENRHCLQHTFERLERQADAILARLDLATALLLEFTSRASSFQSWVFERGRQLDSLRAESGNPEKLDEIRGAFEDLNELILSKRPELNSIEQLAQRIEVEIAAYVDEINDRGGGMSSPICESIALVTTTQLLQQHQVRETVLRAQEDYESLLSAKQDLEHLLQGLSSNSMQYQQRLGEWLSHAEKQILHFNDLPIHPKELTEQSEELADFVNEISIQAPLLENVIENTRELFAHIGGSEAIALQMRTDQLKQRYNNLADDADSKIAIWEKALTLAENLLDGQTELKKHLEDVEEDLQNLSQVSLEEQFQLISTIESDLGPAREQLESIQLISCELQRLTTENRANQLAKESAELLRYFNSVADIVTKRAELLSKAERQSRLIFDVLDFWIDWFNEVQEQIVNAEKPAVDIEQLKQQLKQQRQLNDEIASERNGLRDMIAEASKVARDLNLTLGGQEGQEALLNKVERTKKMAEETAELGSERTAELEQAYALAKELDSEYTELNDYMDGFERELCACDPITTGMPAKVLLAQQQHNNNILQQIQSQRPMVNKFERNVAALRELCSEIDEQNLKQISENVADRFEELVHAFQERGDVLTSSLEHSAQLGDRLNMLLSNLSAALEQLHSQEPPSSRPPIIRRQLAEMSAMFDLLHQREPSFLAMKTQCSEQIELAKQQNLNSGQEASTLAEMHQQRLAELDTRWTELKQAAEGRRLQLETILPLAERFWIQLDLAQQSVVQIRQQTDQFGMNAAAEDLFDSPVKQLQQRQNQLQSLQNGIAECSQGVQQAHFGGLELCNELLGAEEEQSFVQQHLAALQAQWDAFLAHFTQISSSLSLAVNQSLQFHSLLQQLTSFLAAKENQASNIITDNPLNSVDSVREQLQIVDMLRRELDEAAIGREQLNQMGAELCAVMAATKNTSAGDLEDPTLSIRQPLGDLNQRWNALFKRLVDNQQRLERALLDMGQFSQAHAQLLDWIDKTLTTLDGVEGEWRLYSDSGASGLKHIEIALCKLRILQNDISAHQPSYEAILTAGAQILRQEDSSAAASTQPMIELLVSHWSKLDERTQQLFNELEQTRAESTSRNNDLEKWRLWLADLLSEMRTNRPVGGLPETAIAQLDEFRVIQSDVEQRKPQFEEYLNSLEESMEDLERSEIKNGKEDRTVIQVKKLRTDWKTLQEKLAEREKRLRQALEEALELSQGMQEMQDWLLEAENHLAMVPPISRLVETLETQLDTHKTFNDSVQTKCHFMKELNNKGIRMQLSCEKKDAIPMKNKLVSLKHRTDKLSQRSNERLRTLTIALDDSRLFFGAQQELIDWIEEQLKLLDEKETEKMGTGDRIRELLEEHKKLQDQIQRRTGLFDETRLRGNLLGEHAPPAEKRKIESASDQLGNEWTELGKRSLKRQRSLEEALIQSGHFDEVLAELLEWLKKELPPIENELLSQNYFGDIDTMNTLMREHFELVERADTRKPNVLKVQERAQKILASNGGDAQELDQLANRLETLDGQWKRLENSIAERDRRFTSALKKAVDLSEMMHELGTTLQDIEGRVRRLGLPWEEQDVLTEQNQLEKLRKEFMSEHPTLEKQLELARELQSRSHPRAEKPLKELLTTATNRWESLDALLNDKAEKLRLRLEEIYKHERQQNDLFNYLEEKQGQLDYYRRECHDEGQQARLQTLIDEQQMFKADLQQRQPELDEVMKIAAKRRLQSGRHSDNFGVVLNGNKGGINNEDEGEGKDETDQLLLSPLSSTKSSPKRGAPAAKQLKLQEKIQQQEQQKQSQQLSPLRQQNKTKSEILGDSWRKLWTDLRLYEEHLKQRKAHLDEIDRLKNFTFEDWRERYLAWNDHGKARVSDLFRRIDKLGTGRVPRQQFIDGIISSKFPTTLLEMNKVADEFDGGDGLISSKEFMNALRYDPNKRIPPKSETERIHEEIARETARCTCVRRFPILHLSTDKDKVQYGFGFGGSMKRMVRILRSTVMVRVGGGWEALDGFLSKHDPCRAKGRINVDLLPLTSDYHLRPLGAIDAIGEFHRKESTSSNSGIAPIAQPSSSNVIERVLGYSPGQPGPIMKIREKTERSLPMFKRTAENNNGSTISIPQLKQSQSDHSSIIDDIYGSSRIPRPANSRHGGSDIASTPSRPASRSSDIGSDIITNQPKGVRFSGINTQSTSSSERNPFRH